MAKPHRPPKWRRYKYPPQEGYNTLLETGAIVYDVKPIKPNSRNTPERMWTGTNKHGRVPQPHTFPQYMVIFTAPADAWDQALFLFQQENGTIQGSKR